MKIAIIGGGAAGLFLAGKLAGEHSVTVFEAKDRVGKKLLVTGNGRCNYTNTSVGPAHYHSDDARKLQLVLESFGPKDVIRYFQEIGIEPKFEDDGKVFPQSEQAASVLDCLRFTAEAAGAGILTEKKVSEVKKTANGFLVDKEAFEAVVFTTGGASMPQSGSDGSAYAIIKKLGHSVTKIKPALVQLNLEGKYFKTLTGLKIEGRAMLLQNAQVLQEEKGDLLFTDYGISGPPILQLSRRYALESDLVLRLDLYDRYTEPELRQILERRRIELRELSAERFFLGLVPKKLSQVLLKDSGLSAKTKIAEFSDRDLSGILRYLKAWDFKILSDKGFGSAQVTVGGVPLQEVSQTLESKTVKELYFAGEVLNVDGRSGGYNLQWAWASAMAVARGLREKK